MKQIKFSKNEIENDEDTEESIEIAEIERELLRGLKILAQRDRNIKALTIWCNPNYCNGPDYKVQTKIEIILKKLMDQNLVVQNKLKQNMCVFSISNLKNMKKNHRELSEKHEKN